MKLLKENVRIGLIKDELKIEHVNNWVMSKKIYWNKCIDYMEDTGYSQKYSRLITK